MEEGWRARSRYCSKTDEAFGVRMMSFITLMGALDGDVLVGVGVVSRYAHHQFKR